MTEDPLLRIAAALERLAPPPPSPADPNDGAAFVWRAGTLSVAHRFAPLPLDLLTGIDRQRDLVVENSRRLASGLPAHDALLWGARGTGKSALVKAAVGHLQTQGAALAIVEVAGGALDDLPTLFDLLADAAQAFVIFIDDLGFADGSDAPRQLRSLLEGGAEARPANARLYVTSNRRTITPRSMEEAGAVNPRDAADDQLALADRFGLSLGFHVVDQPTYLATVERYAARHDLLFDPADALAWATGRGSRSGRVAWHYVCELASREGKRIE